MNGFLLVPDKWASGRALSWTTSRCEQIQHDVIYYVIWYDHTFYLLYYIKELDFYEKL